MMLCLPDRCVPPLLMDVSTSVGGCSLSFLSPSVTPLRMDTGVTRLAKGYEIVRIMCPTFCQRNDVVDFLDRNDHAALKALFAEGMLPCVPCTDTCPCPAVPAAYRSVPSVLLVGPCFFLRVFVAVPLPRLHQLRASGMCTRMLWFPRHCSLLSGHKKTPKGFYPSGASRVRVFFSLLSPYTIS